MHLRPALLVSAAAGLAGLAEASYVLSDDYMDAFFDQFDFFTGDDPTHGYVNYVDASAASSAGYTRTNDDSSVYIGVDYRNVASGRGRDSVRISTKKTYTHMLAVVDIGHMPGGICGTWPAFWSFGSGGSGWPSQGEIDIVEGVNDQQHNSYTLHSSPDCSISTATRSLLQSTTQNCDTQVDGNVGCSFGDGSDSKSFGSAFNANGGGTYATEWTSAGVNMWFFARGSEPSDALADNPDPAGWGEPTATWGGGGCDWDGHFADHNLIFDTTFCGDWAGNAFQSCSAANNGQTCQQFVQNNPSAFQDAYWQVKAMKVYQDSGSQTSSSSPGAARPSGEPVASSAAVSLPAPVAVPTTLVALPSPQPLAAGPDGGVFVDGLSSPSASVAPTAAAAAAATASSVAQGDSAPPLPVEVGQNGDAFLGSAVSSPSAQNSPSTPPSAPVAGASAPLPVAVGSTGEVFLADAVAPAAPSPQGSGADTPDYAPVMGSGSVHDPVEETHDGIVYDEIGTNGRFRNKRAAGARLRHLHRHSMKRTQYHKRLS